jgi:hypothetical protein
LTPYPKQFSGVSFAKIGSLYGYNTTPTPGAANSGTLLVDFVRDTRFSVERGFHTVAFNLSLTTSTVGAVICYTTDGSEPTETSPIYTAPLTINQTTVVRARAFRDNWLPTNTDTQTYIFPQNWVAQPVLPEGFPLAWGNIRNGSTFDMNLNVEGLYRMDTRITNNALLQAQMLPALTQTLPVLSVTGNLADIFGIDGIYANGRIGDKEVPVAVEYWSPRDARTFATRATLQCHGAAAREFAKKPLRLDFSGPLADGALNFALFPGSPVERFDQLVLRSGGHDSFGVRPRGNPMTAQDIAWQATYLRDEYLRRTEADAGILTPRGKFVHLCLNGLYWGVYNLHERPNADFCQAHQGGDLADWDVIHHRATSSEGPVVIDGDLNDWQALMAEASQADTPTEVAALMARVGGTRFMDHFLTRIWSGDQDWLGSATMPRNDGQPGVTGNVAFLTHKNWYGVANSRGLTTAPWQFFCWDAEFTMGTHALNAWVDSAGTLPTGMNWPVAQRLLTLDYTAVSSTNTPGQLWAALSTQDPFKMALADRIQKMYRGRGPLAPTQAQARLDELTQELDAPMLAESARWGDSAGFTLAVVGGKLYRRWNHTLLTRDERWRDNVAWLRNTFCTQRSEIVVQQFRARGIFPSIDPPTLSPTGGQLAAGQNLTLTNPNANGTIYFTTDGSDPRDPQGGVSGSAVVWTGAETPAARSFTLKTRVLSATNEWSALQETIYTEAVEAAPGDLLVTEVHYHPGVLSQAEIAAGFTDRDQFEFLELYNPTNKLLSLTSLAFASGVRFDFSLHANRSELAPGDFVVICSNMAAFQARYGANPSLAGAFTNSTNLSNGGENVKLVNLNSGATIFDFTYRDSLPWPTAADGSGVSLSLLGLTAHYDPCLADSWRASTALHGTPGAFEPMSYARWRTDQFSPTEQTDPTISGPTGDPDGDGMENLLEYALKRNPKRADASSLLQSNSDGTVDFVWRVRRESWDASVSLEIGNLLQPWISATGQPGWTIQETDPGEGTREFRVKLPFSAPQHFVRLRGTLPEN